MNTIKDQILLFSNEFYKNNNYKCNELWLGYQEESELEEYLKYFAGFSYKKPDISIPREKRRAEFMGMKVRFTSLPTHISVDYNPHYE